MTNNRPIKVTPNERKLLNIFYEDRYSYISTIDMRMRGILQPSQVISSLKRKGILIEKTMGHAEAFGKIYSNIAYFRYVGYTVIL